jgi:hypothetical protein
MKNTSTIRFQTLKKQKDLLVKEKVTEVEMAITPDFFAYSVGLCCASVCTSLPIAEATRRLNAECPTGISSKWSLSKDKTFRDGKNKNGCPCEDHPKTHKHFLFVC